ncbi:RING-type domain-containing protein [Nephila pilipes]|uniref:RING-type domain-containing protein n=1 Tax=Nephila pilipes TaxID=299642 RepID=A0A8X6QVW9_NEPPI|nr:RING-type domain-containing protein [Nephila pilipes]
MYHEPEKSKKCEANNFISLGLNGITQKRRRKKRRRHGTFKASNFNVMQNQNFSLATSVLEVPITSRHDNRNFTITIPNLSALSSASFSTVASTFPTRSVSFAAAASNNCPAITPSNTLLPVNPSIPRMDEFSRNSVSNCDLAEKNEEVKYLYTVQATGEKLVELVDLSEDSQVHTCNSDSQRILRSGKCIYDPGKYLTSNASKSFSRGNFQMLSQQSTISSISEKDIKYPTFNKGVKRKISSEELFCNSCEDDYELINSRGEKLFKSKCGHLFCTPCLKKLNPYECTECESFDLYVIAGTSSKKGPEKVQAPSFQTTLPEVLYQK